MKYPQWTVEERHKDDKIWIQSADTKGFRAARSLRNALRIWYIGCHLIFRIRLRWR